MALINVTSDDSVLEHGFNPKRSQKFLTLSINITITVQEIIEIALDKKGPVHYIFGLLVFGRFDQIQLSSFAQLILPLKSDLKNAL